METILLIEDTIDINESLAECLETEGYKILLANNGRTGVELARKFIPDLIICDLLMPSMSGKEVLHALKDALKTSMIPFIFSTSLAEKPGKTQALKLGADNCIVKPLEPETLLEIVRNLIDKRRKIQLNLN
jgi:DNA-binding response OmpR family regulator